MPIASDDDTPLSVFATNLKALIGRQSVNAWAKKHNLTQSTINRIVTGKMDPTTGQVDDIAKAAGLFSWQLLVPQLDPQNPPVLREANSHERDLYNRLKQTIDELEELRERGNTGPGTFDEIAAQATSDATAGKGSDKKRGTA